MKITTTKVLGVAGVGVALYAVGAFSAIGAFFSTSPAPSGCTDSGYGYQTGYGYGYIVDCDDATSTSGTSGSTDSGTTSSSSSSGGGGGGSGGSRRDFCPDGDRSGSFRDGRCEEFVTTTTGDTTTSGTTTSEGTTGSETTGGDTTGGVTTGGTDMPLSFAELIKKRNEALANAGGTITTPTNNSGMGNLNLPTSLPNTGAVK